jgi:hypothetical protein
MAPAAAAGQGRFAARRGGALLPDAAAPALVVNRRTDAFDVYVGRPSKWGNPFKVGRDGDRATVIRRYEDWLRTQPQLMAALPELRGKVLGCWCAPLACHGEVLARLAKA